MKCAECNGSGLCGPYSRCRPCGGTGKVAYVVAPSFDDEPTQPDIVAPSCSRMRGLGDGDSMFDSEEPRCGDCGGIDIEPFELNGAMRRHCWSCGKVSSREEHTL